MLINTKSGLFVLLALVFLVNFGETSLETALRTQAPVSNADYRGAYGVREIEPEFVDFEFHDQTPMWAIYGYSVSYFVVFPIVGVAVLVALARRRELAPLRVCCLAVTIDYLVSLPWFLLFPVPERWAYPEASAILLSDLWSSNFINSIRPISALNNSFPSTHVSLSVIVVAVCWLFHVRLRHTVTALMISVVVATFALGIHWLADIAAGLAVGALSVVLAWRWTDTSERRELALAFGYPITPRKLRPAGRLAAAGG